MATNRGKAFETKFKSDFLNTVPNASLDRLYDTTNGYKSISNICDFIGYSYPNIFYLECKSHEGNTFPISKLTQYDKLVKKVGIPGVRSGVVLWFVDHDVVCYIPIATFTQLINENKKSVNIKMLNEPDKYNIKIIPSEKKRVFLDSDYSLLLNLQDGE